MNEKNISLTESDWKTIVIALGVAINTHLEFGRKCADAAESGVETLYTRQEWIDLVKKARQEVTVLSELRGRIFRQMNF